MESQESVAINMRSVSPSSRVKFIATDSCDSMAYEGKIGFEYGKQSDLAAIFDDAMVYRLTK